MDVFLQRHHFVVTKGGICFSIAFAVGYRCAIFVVQGTFYNNFPVSEIFIIQIHIVLIRLVGAVQAHQFRTIFRADHVALVAETLAHLFIETGSVDQTHFSFPSVLFAVGQNPDISGNAGVVEQLIRKANNSLQQIIFNNPAADFTFSASGITGEHWRTVKYNTDATSTFFRRVHFGNQMLEKQERAVRDAGQTSAKSATIPLRSRFVLNELLYLFPLHAKRRVAQHIVKGLGLESVLVEAVSQNDTAVGITFQNHIGTARCVCFGV